MDTHIGDAVMGVFGAPVSHGNDPERAVRAALGIHRAMESLSEDVGRKVTVHIGVANGEVVAAATGSDVHSEYTVLGDAVNLASRLDGLAKGGETMISHRVQQAIADLVDVESCGEVPVKGLAEPVRVFRVLGLGERAAAFRTPFVGRTAELAQFSAVLAKAHAGRGSLVSLRGEPGIGKTRLGSEMRREAAHGGFRVHAGLVLDFGAGRDQEEDESAPRAYLEAAKARLESFDYDEALRLLRRGSELAKNPSDRHDLAEREGDVLLYRADSVGALACFRRAAADATSKLEDDRALHHARALVAAAPDAQYHLDQADRVRALVAYRATPDDDNLRRRIERLRAEEETRGLGRGVQTIDRMLASAPGR